MWAVYNGNIHDPESKCVAVAYFKSYLEAGKYLCLHCNGELWSIVGVEAFEKLIEERCELQAQVAVLRGALEEIKIICPTHEPAILTKARKALRATPAESAERVNALVEALEWIEKTTQDAGAQDAASDVLADWRRQT